MLRMTKINCNLHFKVKHCYHPNHRDLYCGSAIMFKNYTKIIKYKIPIEDAPLFQVQYLIFIALVISITVLLTPIFSSDATLYAVISKHIILNNDWINLTVNGHDWLDKPHFPFWAEAISFKIFGINSFAYHVPGMIFYVLGLYFTYKLAQHLYNSKVAWIASVIYLTTLAISISFLDLRAECYLIGEIIPACYFWFLYDEKYNHKCLFWGALFTSCAIMTKGLFTIIPIVSGLMAVCCYQRHWYKFFSWKWFFAVLLITLFIVPELIALLLQFDLHPEKIVFGHTHVSGIKFFFWDSQFGRFFHDGPYVKGDGHFHLLYFTHVFLWQSLPWVFLFILALLHKLKNLNSDTTFTEKSKSIYLLSSFFLTFIIFSISKFQLDFYLSILYPFLAIICGDFLCEIILKKNNFVTIFKIQTGIAFIIFLISCILVVLFVHNTSLMIGSVFLLSSFVCYVYYSQNLSSYSQGVIYSSLSMTILFIILSCLSCLSYMRNDAGYIIATFLNHQTQLAVYNYKLGLKSFEFYTHLPYTFINDSEQLKQLNGHFYLILNKGQLNEITPIYLNNKIIGTVSNKSSDRIVQQLLCDKGWKLLKCRTVEEVVILEVRH